MVFSGPKQAMKYSFCSVFEGLSHWPAEGWNDERFQKYRIGDPLNNEHKKGVYCSLLNTPTVRSWEVYYIGRK